MHAFSRVSLGSPFTEDGGIGVTIQSIFQRHYAAFEREHALPAYVRRAAQRIIDCRTSALGGHVARCPAGHYECICYNSCRHRSCPQCSFLQIEKWLLAQKARLLDTDHFHLIFTIPSELNDLWLLNVRVMTGVLFQAVHEALKTLLADPKFLGARPGVIAALHTWGRNLALHPHVHALVTAGGLSSEECWRTPRKSCLLPRKVLMMVFRGIFRRLVFEALEKDELQLPRGVAAHHLKGLMNRLGRVPWNVKIMKRYRHARGVAAYLARYLRGGPISNRRLVSCDDQEVSFRYRDHREPSRARIMTLTPAQFIQRFLLHVPPPRMKVVRSWGLYASACGTPLELSRRQLSETPIPAPLDTSMLLQELRLAVCPRCPVCGAALLKVAPVMAERPPPRGEIVVSTV